MVATSVTGTAYPYGTPVYISDFSEFRVAKSLETKFTIFCLLSIDDL